MDLKFRYGGTDDVELIYGWANDPAARANSYNPQPITYEAHAKWYESRIEGALTVFYIFQNEEGENIGFIRIDRKDGLPVFSIVVDQFHRGRRYSSEMIRLASNDFLAKNRAQLLKALVFQSNTASYKAFLNAGFRLEEECEIADIPSFVLLKP